MFALIAGAVVACGGKTLLTYDEPQRPFENDILDGGPITIGTATATATTTTTVPPPDVNVPPPPSLPDSAKTIDLGPRRNNDVITLSIPSSTLGFELVLQAPDEFTTVSLARLVSPSGQVVFEDGKPKGTDVPTGAGLGWATGAVPQADVYRKSPVEAGGWTVTLSSDDDSRPIHLWLTLQQTSDGFFHGGELDLHVYIPPGLHLSDPDPDHEVTLSKAATDAALQARLDAFFALLQNLAGIGRGKVRYHALGAQYREIDLDTELASAFESTKLVPDGQALHVLFTNDLGDALGIAGAIPGSATKNGTSISAIAVRQYDGSSAALDGYTMLHEMGHFAGLSHTTEFVWDDDAGYYDPLLDTPACDGGVTDTNVLKCPDYSNVMFPTGEQEDGLLTLAQVRVIRGSPIYRAKANGPIIAPPRLPLPKSNAPHRPLPPYIRRCAFGAKH
jgi:hypothetical protein